MKIPKTVGEIMSSPVITVRPSDTVKQALELMERKYISSVIVVSDDLRPVGILTERDVVRLLLIHNEKILEKKMEEVMSTPVVVCRPKTPIAEALMIMHKNGIRRLPVIEDEKLVGIITQRDITYWTLMLLGYPTTYLYELDKKQK